MLVDDDNNNVNIAHDLQLNHYRIKELFHCEMDINSILKNIDQKIAKISITKEELKGIEFNGGQVLENKIIKVSEKNKDKENYDYLDKVEEWIGIKQNVHYEPLKGSFDSKAEQRRVLRINEEVQVQEIPLIGKPGTCAEVKQQRTEIAKKQLTDCFLYLAQGNTSNNLIFIDQSGYDRVNSETNITVQATGVEQATNAV
ncbi:MAG: hypothetical protein PV340_01645 [Wolbachia sp.]|nr:hypothetical protein [Wolbachia sp.]MDD9336312.1 hypothetical protein [Wolbachia sp.]